MAIRNIGTTLRNSLLKEDAFSYAHLVKFEKPLATDLGKSPRRAKDYSYITDGSMDIIYDDLTQDAAGNNTGSQTYIANKLKKVGPVSETIQAKASSMTITLSAAALNTSVTDLFTTTASSITGTKDLVEEGFREGDLISISGGTNNGKEARINTFSNNNLTANITAITSLSSESSTSITISFSSPEIDGVITDRSLTGYARYINRDVFIYKAHMDATGSIIGDPYLLFKGIISGGKMTEDPEKEAVISWTLSSHWADFSRVQGRITSDASHRALNSSNKPDPEATIRPAYAKDLGFEHSELAVNLIGVYQVQETRYKEKRRGGLAGVFGGKKMVEYEVTVDRETDLRFNLEAKYLPVVYGVNKIDSIPFFVDTLNNDASTVYCAYALCEGEIGGLYDVYFDDTSSICIDVQDSGTRGSQSNQGSVDVVCSGRMDRGDTLTPQNINSGSTATASAHSESNGASSHSSSRTENETAYASYNYNTPSNTFAGGATEQGAGVTHEKGTAFSTPIDTRLIFHSGKSDQKADALLLSKASNFKLGNAYYSGTSDYWGASHRVLDTAYAVAEYKVSEGETTIPSLDFVVRGKGVKCYNYDFSYAQHPSYTSGDAAIGAFTLGETVTVKKTSDDSTLGTAVIKDTFERLEVNGTKTDRIQFIDFPPIGTTTSFYIVSGSNTYHLQTYNNTENTGTVAETLKTQVSSVAANSNGVSADLTLSSPSTAMQDALAISDLVTLAETASDDFSKALLDEYTFSYSGSGNVITEIGSTATGVANVVGSYVTLKDAVVLGSGASSTDNAYNGMVLELTKVKSDGSTKVQERKIVDYDGGSRVAVVEAPFEDELLPTSSDTYKIFSKDSDIRVSINPVMQLLDYLTNNRYGRDLDLSTDIDLESFLASARTCDTGSDVTLLIASNNVPSVGAIYKYTSGTRCIWEGEVKSTVAVTVNNQSYTSITFTNVLGKLAKRWENWKYFSSGDLYYYLGGLHQKSGNGTVSSTPSTTSSVTSFNITKVSGTGNASLPIDVSSARATFEGNPVVKTFINEDTYNSGYSLYDSDDVKYWRYLGWEAQNQRHVTRHQTNTVLNTSTPIFENINSMLGHFNGMLRYSNGKYSLSVKGASISPSTITIDGVDYVAEDISDEDIIGSIAIEDKGQKGTFNQVDLSIVDPQNRFESRSISLFDSTYLKEDRMVPKKGSIRTPSVTNYFNARVNAKQYLLNSRSSLKVNFEIGPKGLLLVAGNIIRITYPRFGWSNKLYRVTNLNYNDDCTTQVTAEEHDDNAYLVESPRVKGVIKNTDPTLAIVGAPSVMNMSGTGDGVSQNDRGGIELQWTNIPAFNSATYSVEIHRSSTNDRDDAKLVGISKSNFFTDPIVGEGQQTFYYWLRYNVLSPSRRTSSTAPRSIVSDFFPSGSQNGRVGISDGAQDAITVNMTNDNVTVPCNSAGTPSSFDNTGTTIIVYLGGTLIAYDDSSPYTKPSFRVSNVTTSNVTRDSSPTTTSNSYALGPITALSQNSGTITLEITVTDSLGRETVHTKIQTFTKGRAGIDASPSTSVAQIAAYKRSSTSLLNTTVTGGSFNFSNNTLTPPTGWSVAPTSGTDPQYVILTTASVSGSTTTDSSLTWSSPVLALNDGDTGLSTFQAVVFRRDSSIPSTPTGGSFNFGTNTLTAPSGWNVSPPGGSNIMYASRTQFQISGDTGTDTSVTWSTPAKFVEDGSDGLSTFAFSVFKRSASAPATPTGGSYNFGTQAITAPTGWQAAAPATNGNPLYESRTLASIQGTTGTDTSLTWTSPLKTQEDGATGARTASGFLYYQSSSSSAPSAPSASSYNFGTGVFGSKSSGWDEDAPTFAAANTNKYWYVRFTVEESTYQGSQSVDIGSVLQGIGFSGLVTFQADGDIEDGTNTYDPAARVNANTTQINGGKITTGSIDAAQLTISANSSTASSMFFDGTNNRIDIKDSSGNLRVRIGNLS